jgi:hypothetical protein
MSFAFPYASEDPGLGSVSLPNVAAHDVQVWISGSVQKVTVPSGSYSIKAVILNPSDLAADEGLSWNDSSGVIVGFESPALQLSRGLESLGATVVVYPATEILFPIGSRGVVSVLGPVNMTSPSVELV